MPKRACLATADQGLLRKWWGGEFSPPPQGTAVQIKSRGQVAIQVSAAGGREFDGRLMGQSHSPPKLGGGPSRSEGGAVCSKTNSTD